MRVARVTAVIADFASRSVREREFAAFCDALRDTRATALCFARDFPWRERLLSLGYREMSLAPLYSQLLPRIALELSKTGTTAALFAERLGVHEQKTLDALCRAYRYVLVDTRVGGGVFHDYRRKLGLSLLPLTRERLSRADAAFFFAPCESPVTLPRDCVAAAADGYALTGATCVKRVTGLSFDIDDFAPPDGFSRDQIVSAMLDCGAIDVRDVRLTGIRVG
jgi:hypothetical protein